MSIPSLRERVRRVMEDSRWRTLRELARQMYEEFGKAGSDSGISAKLRDLRKRNFGLREVLSRRTTRPDADPDADLWEYRLVASGEESWAEAKALVERCAPPASSRAAQASLSLVAAAAPLDRYVIRNGDGTYRTNFAAILKAHGE